MREPQDVCRPRTQMLSLIAIGMPASGGSVRSPAVRCEATSVSIASARFKAAWRSISRKALRVRLSFSAAWRADSTTARALVSRRMISFRISIADFIKRVSNNLWTFLAPSLTVGFLIRDSQLPAKSALSALENDRMRDRAPGRAQPSDLTRLRSHLGARFRFVPPQASILREQVQLRWYQFHSIARHRQRFQQSAGQTSVVL